MSKIEKWKSETRFNTSEELFGIENPPDYQCHLIDEVINSITNNYSESNLTGREDEEDLIEILGNINYELYGLDSKMEELRTAVEDLRDWGNSWKELCKKLIENHNIDIDDI